MSWSLQVQNGDLVLSGNQLATVSDGDKLAQDMTCAVLTHLGENPDHPAYGSLIDGGIVNGSYVPGAIGMPNNQAAANFVQSEISRLASDYQKNQIARNLADASTYGKPTLTPGETLVALGNLTIQSAQDNLLVTVPLQTGANVVTTAITVGS
jgi:hypothetical protein